MRGAFLVGALKTINNKLGTDYFDTIFSTSVGVFEQAFYAAGQLDIMENTWREYVHGRQLINFFNPLKGKPILDLDYLIDIFQSDKSRLDTAAVKNSKPKLLTFLADYEKKKLVTMDLKEGPIFDIMKATSAIPFLYPRKILINGRRYTDCWIVPERKFQQFIQENLKEYDEVVAISAYAYDLGVDGIANIIKPSKMPVRGVFDTNRERIIETIKQGEVDAEKFIIENNLINKK